MSNTSIESLCQIEKQGSITCMRFAIGPKGTTTEEVFIDEQRVSSSISSRAGAAVKSDVIAALQTVWPLGWHRGSYEVKDGWGIYEYRQMDYPGEGVYDPQLQAEDLERADRKAMGDPAMQFTADEKRWHPHWDTSPKVLANADTPIIYVDVSSKHGIALRAVVLFEQGRFIDANVERVDGRFFLNAECAAFDAVLRAMDVATEREYDSVVIRCLSQEVVDACRCEELLDGHSLKKAHETFQQMEEHFESLKVEHVSRETDSGCWPAQQLMNVMSDSDSLR